MQPSAYIELARQKLRPGARPWEEPSACREIARRLRHEGENDLADQLEQAAKPPETFLGGTTTP